MALPTQFDVGRKFWTKSYTPFSILGSSNICFIVSSKSRDGTVEDLYKKKRLGTGPGELERNVSAQRDTRRFTSTRKVGFSSVPEKRKLFEYSV